MSALSVTSAAGGIQSTTRTRAADAARIGSVTGKIIKLWGLLDTVGSGEGLFDVVFPVLFLELPSFAFGGSMIEGSVIVTGSYPTVSVVVHSFDYDARVSGPRYYKGAKLIIVTSGLPDQAMTIHYQFEARAIVPPVTMDQLAEDIV